MKILKSKSGISDWELTEFVKSNQITKEDILTITSDGAGVVERFTLFYYEEPKPENEKKSFWG
jgi:hypothetical protein